MELKILLLVILNRIIDLEPYRELFPLVKELDVLTLARLVAAHWLDLLKRFQQSSIPSRVQVGQKIEVSDSVLSSLPRLRFIVFHEHILVLEIRLALDA